MSNPEVDYDAEMAEMANRGAGWSEKEVEREAMEAAEADIPVEEPTDG
jgi:hypothetical protein